MAIFLADEQATIGFGQKLAQCWQTDFPETGLTIYLHGDLGAGKSTLARGLIQFFLPQAKVKSPTYTLVEAYEITNISSLKHIYHFDLYRLADPEELEYLGGRDYFSSDSLCLIEWPSRGEGWLTKADLEITLEYQNESRVLTFMANTDAGQHIIDKFT